MQQAAIRRADTVVVLDFETTGMSPDRGDRVIEVGAIRLEAGQVTARYQALMNPGVRINAFIENLTGITNDMVRDAPCCESVMQEFSDFIAGYDLVAHNACFDRRFLDAELARIGHDYSGEFACSMLAARRLYPQAPNHKLGTLVEYRDIPTDGTFHRALADAGMTACLWLGMLDDLRDRYALETIQFPVMQALMRVSRAAVDDFLGSEQVQRTHRPAQG
jgi:DNA polymerase-3 subunit epsilon